MIFLKNTSDKLKLFTNLTYLLTIEYTEDKGAAGLNFTYLNSKNNQWETIPSTWLTIFKPYSDTYTTYDNSMFNYCSKPDPNNKSTGLYQTVELCKNYLINNPATNLVKSIIDYCNTSDNQKTDYCNIPTQDAINIQKKNIGNKEFENEIKKNRKNRRSQRRTILGKGARRNRYLFAPRHNDRTKTRIGSINRRSVPLFNRYRIQLCNEVWLQCTTGEHPKEVSARSLNQIYWLSFSAIIKFGRFFTSE